MNKTFKDIILPNTLEYRSDGIHIPLEFYLATFPLAKQIDLHLGYFSSNAIRVLNTVFAQFIYNGGKLRLIINNILSEQDKELLLNNEIISDELEIDKIIKNLSRLKKELKGGQHFFDCLKYLIKKDRLEILPVLTKNNSLSHYKNILLTDHKSNILYTTGSANFTANGILTNGESFKVSRSWGHDPEIKTIKEATKRFTKIFKKEHIEYRYINAKYIKSAIRKSGKNKDVDELLIDEINILKNESDTKIIKFLNLAEENFKDVIKKYNNSPRFPFDNPRAYQTKAQEAWVKNDYKGIFAMATGTGKTITSLNCIVEEYKKNNMYSVIITVPTVTLVNQWVEEAKKFNFKSIISTAQNKDWEKELNRLLFNKKHKIGTSHNYIFITTYASFNKQKCQRTIKKIDDRNTVLIADEVHNLGATNSLKNLPFNIYKRIGLSATPERIYDEEGSIKLYDFFNSHPPSYTYKFSMRDAIDQEFLTPYYYYPYFVNLDHDELEAYLVITRQLVKHFDFKKEKFKESATHLLIKRKRIIHKANNKKQCLKDIFKDVKLKNQSLKYTFIYVPEGYEANVSENENHIIEEEDIRVINEYSKIINGFGYKTYQFLGETKNREKILEQFKNGELEILTAMKALDEGVDIPITKNAIFCASTGNPRQFIQRRGRVLRKFKGKSYANIYDMIVVPSKDLMMNEDSELKDMEIRIFKGELKRVANFLYSSENMIEVINDKIRNIAEEYNLDIFELINENIENDKIK